MRRIGPIPSSRGRGHPRRWPVAAGARTASSDGPKTAKAVKVDFPKLRRLGLQGLHGLRLRRLRRQVVQPDRVKAASTTRRRTSSVQTAQVESKADSEYGRQHQRRWSSRTATQITTVGFLLGDATLAAAKKNPDIDFSIVDFAYSDPKTGNTAPKNLKGLTFDTAQPSYLAGYLAAAQSESPASSAPSVALPIPTVTIFMEGFRQGVETYNEENGTDVKLARLGRQGRLVHRGLRGQDARARRSAEQLIQQGADILFPVAGPAGLGGLQAAKDEGAKAHLGGHRRLRLDRGVLRHPADLGDEGHGRRGDRGDQGVRSTTRSTTTPYVGTLENGGVGLAPYHDADGDDPDKSQGPRSTRSASRHLDGDITIKSKAVPKS